jgi:hypothetical protein
MRTSFSRSGKLIYPAPSRDGLAYLVLLAAVGVVAILFFANRADAAEPSRTLTVLQSFAPHHTDQDESAETRAERLAEIAAAIDAAVSETNYPGSKRELQALLLAVGKHESHFSRDVCSGKRLGDKGRAFGCWQSHDKDRSGGVAADAQRAALALARAARHCGGTATERVRGALSLYARGNSCSWSGAGERIDTVRAVSRQLGGAL